MPTTYTLVAPTTVDLDLKIKDLSTANKALIDVVSMSTDNDGNASADYIFNGGPGRDVIGVKVRRNFDSKKNQTSASIRMSTSIRETVSETGSVRDIPIEVVMAWNYRDRFCPDASALNTLVQIVFGLYVNGQLSATNGYPVGNIIESIDRSVITQLWG